MVHMTQQAQSLQRSSLQAINMEERGAEGLWLMFSAHTIGICTWTKECFAMPLSLMPGGRFWGSRVFDMTSSCLQHTFTLDFTYSGHCLVPTLKDINDQNKTLSDLFLINPVTRAEHDRQQKLNSYSVGFYQLQFVFPAYLPLSF